MIRFAYRLMHVGKSAALRRMAAALVLTAAAGCTAGVKPAATGTAGSSGGASGVAGSGGTASTAGRGGTGLISPVGTGGAVSTNPDAGACQMKDFTFEPKIPTVVLLVDRSGSMFSCLNTAQSNPCADKTNSAWTRFKDGILPVVQSLQADVRFGFTAFNGVSGPACPTLETVAPALNNYDAIAARYNGLPFRVDSDKWETPTRKSLEQVGAALMADTTPGDKYILFVTDGEPDYCGDGNALCPPDAVVAQIQTLKAAGITTIVFGLTTMTADVAPNTLKAFATAGAGEPTLPPLRTGNDINAIFDQCFPGGDSSAAGWKADFLAVAANASCATNSNACRGRTVGTYSTTAGPTEAYRPDPANQAQLITQLSNALAGVKSCVFDLTPVKVNLSQLAKASVLIEGVAVPLDMGSANGWNMTTDIQLELFGTACDTWRNPNAKNIQFNFPCEIIVD
jgi:hypothetical protein